MMISSFGMPSIVGFITSLITNGPPSIRNWQCVKVSQNRLQPNLELHDDVNRSLLQGLNEYFVTLSNDEVFYIAAVDSMDAAYSALELSEDRHQTILDIQIVNEQTTLFPEQLG